MTPGGNWPKAQRLSDVFEGTDRRTSSSAASAASNLVLPGSAGSNMLPEQSRTMAIAPVPSPKRSMISLLALTAMRASGGSLGGGPIATVSALVCFVPLLYNLVTGLRAADRDAIDLLRSAGASRLEILRDVEIPSALPHLFAGLRTSVGLALIGAVLSEWFALVSHGLGRQIQKGMATSSAPLIWACAFALALIGSVSLLLLAVAERILVPGRRART